MNTQLAHKRLKSAVCKEEITLPKEVQEKLRKLPKTTCPKCGSRKSYLNPFKKCHSCKKKFCFDHIWGGQINKSMKITDLVRSICDECKEKFHYEHL